MQCNEIKMTDLRKMKNENDLFQNLKMANKVITLTKKSLAENIKRKDILKTIVDLKEIVNELEHIAKETDIVSNIDKGDEKTSTKRKRYFVNCSLLHRKVQKYLLLQLRKA